MPEEKVFNIPLRKAFEEDKSKRAKFASKFVREFLIRHMKTENVKIGNSIKDALWKRGIQNIPRKIRIHTTKEEDIVYAEILGVEIKTPSKEEVKKKEEKKKEKEQKIKEERKERRKKSIQDEIEEEVKGKTEEVPKETKEDLPKEEKPIEKPEERATQL
jgi:large subunit ribosomal protein L31e